MSGVKFEETQKFRQKGMYFVYALLLGLFLLFASRTIEQIVFHKTFGSKPAPSFVLVILAAFTLAMLVVLYSMKFETLIIENGVYFRWLPFQKTLRHLGWQEIDEAKIINYGSVGFGLRFTPFGTIYNVSGSTGLKIVCKSGKEFILGTQKPKELAEFLQRINAMQKTTFSKNQVQF